jgi:hypothetical protein
MARSPTGSSGREYNTLYPVVRVVVYAETDVDSVDGLW